jgi:hypothetical protein
MCALQRTLSHYDSDLKPLTNKLESVIANNDCRFCAPEERVELCKFQLFELVERCIERQKAGLEQGARQHVREESQIT